MPRLRSRAALTAPSAPTASSTRPRRGTTNQPPPAAVIQRSSPEETRQSIHLTVKASPGKLRKATSGKVAKTAVSSRNIVSGKRASRSSRVITEIDSDDEDEDEEEEREEPDPMDLDDEDDEVDAEGEEDDDVDAEGEEDEEMEDLTPAPRPRTVVSSNKNIPAKPSIKVAAPQDSVEATEMAMDDDDDDDEELSELESDLDGDEEDAEGEDEDAEGEEDDEMVAQNGAEDVGEGMESDDGTPRSMSRSHTPDLSKMTRRQRALVAEETDSSLMSLSNEAQKKKHLTAEEHAMRRAEMARRRKNLSEKRNEEEKMDTINRLLKKQPPKRGRKVIQDESGLDEELEVEKANPLYVRYTQTATGTKLAVPEEWLQAPVGTVFTGSLAKPLNRPFSGRMVEEVS
ncbi:PAPA-1-like conserved region-domain-containing protein [Massariosphaeria phaeospora]|uniref:PAPA-1-like conserved region-domain-containing protein n=1 Tax=Massariosphaeria phaeospora TaxID=100035 RepID=A0A7C8I646_9PLEO|nr:PAPA-1-like conserved region-domain-containing protein [Massariosphaeria phaeospora]